MQESASKRRTGDEIVQNVTTRRRKRKAMDAGPQGGAATGSIMFPVAAKKVVKMRILDADDAITMKRTMMKSIIGSQRTRKRRGRKDLGSAQGDADPPSAKMPSRKSKKTKDGQRSVNDANVVNAKWKNSKWNSIEFKEN